MYEEHLQALKMSYRDFKRNEKRVIPNTQNNLITTRNLCRSLLEQLPAVSQANVPDFVSLLNSTLKAHDPYTQEITLKDLLKRFFSLEAK